MKNSIKIFVTLAFALAPAAAFAQDAQTSIQTNTNSASAVGDANLILQDATQQNDQLQVGIDDYHDPAAQLSVQDNANAGAAIGEHNIINQDATQSNVQTQIDAGSYVPAIPSYPVGY